MAAITSYDEETLSEINPEDTLLGTTITPGNDNLTEVKNFSIRTLVSYLVNGSDGALLPADSVNGIGLASTSANGLLGVDDKSKLDHIVGNGPSDSITTTVNVDNLDTGAFNPTYQLPTSTSSQLGGVTIGTGLQVTPEGQISVPSTTGLQLETGNGIATTALRSDGKADTATLADQATEILVVDRTLEDQTTCEAAGGTWTTLCTRPFRIELIASAGTPTGNGWITFEDEA